MHYITDEKIDYAFFPGAVRTAGVMRFHKGAVKLSSMTENSMVRVAHLAHGRNHVIRYISLIARYFYSGTGSAARLV